MDQLEKIKLDLLREAKAAEFDIKFNLIHVPIIKRLFKIDSKYQIQECTCYFCNIANKEIR